MRHMHMSRRALRKSRSDLLGQNRKEQDRKEERRLKIKNFQSQVCAASIANIGALAARKERSSQHERKYRKNI